MNDVDRREQACICDSFDGLTCDVAGEDCVLVRRNLHRQRQDQARWLRWSGGQYPDDSPGDVISADVDGTIVLDDGVTTWNPLRALSFKVAELERVTREREQFRIEADCAMRDFDGLEVDLGEARAELERVTRELRYVDEGFPDPFDDKPLTERMAGLRWRAEEENESWRREHAELIAVRGREQRLRVVLVQFPNELLRGRGDYWSENFYRLKEAIIDVLNKGQQSSTEPCPNCGCPGEQFDGHCCEDFK